MSCILWFDLSLKLPWQLVNSLPNLVGDDWLTVSGHRAIHILEWWLEVTDTIYNPTTDPMTACELPLHWSLTIDQPPWPTHDSMTAWHDLMTNSNDRAHEKTIWQTPIPPDNNYHQKPLFWECNFKSFNLVPTKPNSHQFVPLPPGSKNQFGFKSNSRNVVFSSWPQIWGQLSLRQIQFCILIILTFILNIFVTDWELLSLKHMQPGSMTHNTA